MAAMAKTLCQAHKIVNPTTKGTGPKLSSQTVRWCVTYMCSRRGNVMSQDGDGKSPCPYLLQDRGWEGEGKVFRAEWWERF